jgi:hypothetical protein
MKKWKYEGVMCKVCGKQAVVRGYCRKCYDHSLERKEMHRIESRNRYRNLKGGMNMGEGMNEVVSAVKAEIKKTEEKLASLRRMEEETKRIMGIPNIVQPNIQGAGQPIGNVRRKIKYTHFSDIETKQMINMYNNMNAIPSLDLTDKIAKIASVMKQPYRRVYNKIYNLMDEGKLPKENSISPFSHVGARPRQHRIAMHLWTENEVNQLIHYTNLNKSPLEISQLIGVENKVISNKLNKLRAEGKLPYKQKPLDNPLATM